MKFSHFQERDTAQKRGKAAAEKEFKSKLKALQARFEAERRAMKEENEMLRERLQEGRAAPVTSDSVFVFKGEPQVSDGQPALEDTVLNKQTVPAADVEKVIAKYKKLVDELKDKLKKCLDDLERKVQILYSAV